MCLIYLGELILKFLSLKSVNVDLKSVVEYLIDNRIVKVQWLLNQLKLSHLFSVNYCYFLLLIKQSSFILHTIKMQQKNEL